MGPIGPGEKEIEGFGIGGRAHEVGKAGVLVMRQLKRKLCAAVAGRGVASSAGARALIARIGPVT